VGNFCHLAIVTKKPTFPATSLPRLRIFLVLNLSLGRCHQEANISYFVKAVISLRNKINKGKERCYIVFAISIEMWLN
jgi:hypothetical protein